MPAPRRLAAVRVPRVLDLVGRVISVLRIVSRRPATFCNARAKDYDHVEFFEWMAWLQQETTEGRPMSHPSREDIAMPQTTESGPIATRILDAARGRWLVGLAGVPGAGKSTVAQEVAARAPGTVVIPMDGYHLPRAKLTADGLARRGAPDTFDPDAMRADLLALRRSGTGRFPAFDHAAKDPEQGAIAVPPDTPLVIIEGLYLLLRSWRMTDLFDFTVFLDCDLEIAMRRVATRHLACGLAATPSEADRRARGNDYRNALTILNDGCRDRADLVISVA
jgi:pantothenate kinase